VVELAWVLTKYSYANFAI